MTKNFDAYVEHISENYPNAIAQNNTKIQMGMKEIYTLIAELAQSFQQQKNGRVAPFLIDLQRDNALRQYYISPSSIPAKSFLRSQIGKKATTLTAYLTRGFLGEDADTINKTKRLIQMLNNLVSNSNR